MLASFNNTLQLCPLVGFVQCFRDRNALVVVAAKGKRGNMPYGRKGTAGQQMPSMPEFDPKDDTPRFVLFIKSKVVSRQLEMKNVNHGCPYRLPTFPLKQR